MGEWKIIIFIQQNIFLVEPFMGATGMNGLIAK